MLDTYSHLYLDKDLKLDRYFSLFNGEIVIWLCYFERKEGHLLVTGVL